MVADIQDASIGETCVLDKHKVDRMFRSVALAADLKFDLVLIEGKEATPLNILSKMDSLDVQADDVVVFYYTGHGYRVTDKESIWPIMCLSQENFPGLDFETALTVFQEKSPRLFLAMADCCNSVIEGMSYEDLSLLSRRLENPDQRQKNAKELFRKSRGSIYFMGCDVTQYSFCNWIEGGYFTHSFITALRNSLISPQVPDWQTVCEKTVLGVKKKMEPSSYTQTPVYSLGITK
jgi:hypothetical protein